MKCFLFESYGVVFGLWWYFVLLASPCIVFQRVCVLCLWSQCVSRCSLHMSDVCVCMMDVISEFNSEIEGSLALRALMLFLCSMLYLMCSGSSLHVGCILPFGMLCLSVWRMMFVKMVFVVCMSGGGRMSEKAASVSVVNCVQFAFL